MGVFYENKKMKLYDSWDEYQECEKWWGFKIFMSVSGFYGAFTYSIRGGIFFNAQTVNFVLFAMALGRAQWSRAIYFLIPMSAYFLGSLLSESLPRSIKKLGALRWDTLILIEMLVVIFLASLPESAPIKFHSYSLTLSALCSTIHFVKHKAFPWQHRSVPTTFVRPESRFIRYSATKI